jgi:hypothetical protein
VVLEGAVAKLRPRGEGALDGALRVPAPVLLDEGVEALRVPLEGIVVGLEQVSRSVGGEEVLGDCGKKANEIRLDQIRSDKITQGEQCSLSNNADTDTVVLNQYFDPENTKL